MESIGRGPDSVEARDALASIQDVQRAVRDTPWPTWLYLLNAVLLGTMALTPLLQAERRTNALIAIAVTIIGANATAGYRMGAPWVLPTSRGFLAAVGASAFCVVAALAVADVTGRTWPIVALAVAAPTIYLAGAVAHRRSTGRPR